MNNSLFALSLIILLISSCKNDDVNINSERFTLIESASITEEFPYLVSGDQTVLVYGANTPSSYAQFEDFGLAEGVYLGFDELPNGINRLDNRDIANISFRYDRTCFCLPLISAEMQSVDLELVRVGRAVVAAGFITIHFTLEGEAPGETFEDTRVVSFNNAIFEQPEIDVF